MKSFEWSDQMGSRGRASWLLLRKGEELAFFAGATVPGWCVVQTRQFTKNGKWSHTTYRLQLADDVVAMPGRLGWESGGFLEGIGAAASQPKPGTWAEAAKCLGVSIDAAKTFLRAHKKVSAEHLDKVEAELAGLQ